jgi:signal transduction histidine kinase
MSSGLDDPPVAALDPGMRRISVMYEVAQVVLVANSLNEVTERLLRGVEELIAPWRCSVGMIDWRERTLQVHMSRGRGRIFWDRGRSIPLAEFGGDMRRLEYGEVDMVQDLAALSTERSKRAHFHGKELKGQLLVPIVNADRLIGTLNIGADSTDFFTDEHVEIAKEFCSLLSASIGQLRLRQEMDEERERAERAARVKSAFLANMSHEIRTPLNAVIGLTTLLLDRELPSDERELVTAIRSSGEALVALVSDVLDFSKIEAGHMDLERRSFVLKTLVEQSLDLVAASARNRGLRLKHRMAPGLPTRVVGDGGRVRQVLVNLLGNAVKFTHDGTIEVRVASKATGANKLMLEFQVADTGIGIPPERLETIFEDFNQADVSTTRKYGGTGLGLAIVRRLVQLMGGDIAVSSVQGHGTTFEFTIEVEPDSQIRRTMDAPEEALERMDPTLGERIPLRILIAEDNLVNQMVALQILGRMGYRADAVGNGLEVLTALEREKYDLVLMDIQMPEMDGIQATRAIRRKYRNKSPRIVALTAAAFTDMHDQCLAAGMEAFITKPLRVGELRRTIESIGSYR